MLDFTGLDIKEYFTPSDAVALQNIVKKIKHPGMVIVEVGSWKGYSTAFLADSIRDCGSVVYAVDHWKGNEATWSTQVADTEDIYKIFEHNLKTLNLWQFIKPMVMDSEIACATFADQSIDLVFLDADHRYKQFKTDLESWYPKIKVGGIICGHDCEGYYSMQPEEVKKLIDSQLDADFIFDLGCHPGVMKALFECFEDRYFRMANSTVWYKQKGQIGRD